MEIRERFENFKKKKKKKSLSSGRSFVKDLCSMF